MRSLATVCCKRVLALAVVVVAAAAVAGCGGEDAATPTEVVLLTHDSFAISKEVARQTRSRWGWWVWVEVPDDTPEYLLDDGTPYPGNYRLTIDFVNSLELHFEPGD